MNDAPPPTPLPSPRRSCGLSRVLTASTRNAWTPGCCSITPAPTADTTSSVRFSTLSIAGNAHLVSSKKNKNYRVAQFIVLMPNYHRCPPTLIPFHLAFESATLIGPWTPLAVSQSAHPRASRLQRVPSALGNGAFWPGRRAAESSVATLDGRWGWRRANEPIVGRAESAKLFGHRCNF